MTRTPGTVGPAHPELGCSSLNALLALGDVAVPPASAEQQAGFLGRGRRGLEVSSRGSSDQRLVTPTSAASSRPRSAELDTLWALGDGLRPAHVLRAQLWGARQRSSCFAARARASREHRPPRVSPGLRCTGRVAPGSPPACSVSSSRKWGHREHPC